MRLHYPEKKPKPQLKFRHYKIKHHGKKVDDSLDKEFGKTAKSTRTWTARYFG